MSDIQDRLLDIRRRIAEEKIKWGFDEEPRPARVQPKQEVTVKQSNIANDLKTMLLNRKKMK